MTDFLLLAFIFLVAGVLSVPIASRLGLGSVLGYLIAGIVISPVLAVIGVDVVSIQHFAEFGVVMMLFLVGLELEPKKLWEMRSRLLGLGGMQVGGTALLVAAAALALGQPVTVAIAIGLIFSLSSTAIVLQTLNEKGLMKSDGGQASFSVLLFQDIAVIPMLALLPLLAIPELVELAASGADAAQMVAHGTADGHAAVDHAGEAAHGGGGHGAALSLVDGRPGWQVALITIAAIGAVVGLGVYLVGPLFRFIAVARLRELFVATALMMVVGIALLMSLVGLSPALGTFIAGVVLANSEYRHELESDIEPFRGLLLGLFFMTVGAGINFTLLFDNLASILLLTLGLIFIKALVLHILSRVFKLHGSDQWLFTLGLAQAGEFGFVLLSFVVANHVIPSDTADQLLLVVALSMLLTPALFIAYEKVFVPKFAKADKPEADEIDELGEIIIAGHGRVGGIVNRMLRLFGFKTTVIDYSSEQLEMLRTFGVKVYYGDASRPDLLEAAGIADAKMLIVALDDREAITTVVEYVRKTHPKVHVIARAVDRNHVYDLWYAGCRDIIRDTFDGSMRIGRSAFEALGLDHEAAEELRAEFEKRDRQALRDVAEIYVPNERIADNPELVAKVRAMMEEQEQELSGRGAEMLAQSARRAAEKAAADAALNPSVGTTESPAT